MKYTIKGFTLIECLVALLIISIVLASATRTISLSVDDVSDNYAREVAMWLADNQINDYKITKTFPELGIKKITTSMANLDFIMNIDVSTTGNPYFRKIVISIAKMKMPSYTIFKTVSFIAQY